jgi:hypothetical protein
VSSDSEHDSLGESETEPRDESGALAFIAEDPELVEQGVNALAADHRWSYSDESGEIEMIVRARRWRRSCLESKFVNPAGSVGWGERGLSKQQLDPPFYSLRFYVAGGIHGEFDYTPRLDLAAPSNTR